MTQNAHVLRVLSDADKLPFSVEGKKTFRNILITGAVRTQMISPEEGKQANSGKSESKKDEQTDTKDETSDGTRGSTRS